MHTLRCVLSAPPKRGDTSELRVARSSQASSSSSGGGRTGAVMPFAQAAAAGSSMAPHQQHQSMHTSVVYPPWARSPSKTSSNDIPFSHATWHIMAALATATMLPMVPAPLLPTTTRLRRGGISRRE